MKRTLELTCKLGHRFEMFTDIDVDSILCSCGSHVEFSPRSFPGMDYDSYWSGVYNESLDKVFYSKSGMRQYAKDRGLSPVESGMDKDRKQQKKYQEEKQDKERHDHVVKHVMEY